MIGILRQLSIVFFLVLCAVLVNLPIINFDMMYPEQPLMYIANQKIHHFSDLLGVYMHPQIFHYAIPFFRPSGHFLMYQLLTPLIGWHQTQMLFVVNFIFLGLAGYYMLRLYMLLFPRYWMGGLVGLAIYVSHPSLALVKVSILHFEYAHVFFALMGLYYFILFCMKNDFTKNKPLSAMRLLVASLFLYIVAVTFKEPALMLGVVYLAYLCLSVCQSQPPLLNLRRIVFNKQILQLIFLLMALTVMLSGYLTLGWPSSHNPVSKVFVVSKSMKSIRNFLIFIFNWNILAGQQESWGVGKEYMRIWRTIVFPGYAAVIMFISLILSISAGILLYKNKLNADYKTSFSFLIIAAILFLVIPLGWGVGAPWHYHLTLVFLCLLIGFSVEYLGNIFIADQSRLRIISVLIAAGIALSAVPTNIAIINYYHSIPAISQPLALIHNAVFAAPRLPGKFAKNSLLIVEDSIYKSSYLLGSGYYPLQLYYLTNINYYMQLVREPTHFFLPVDVNYSGSLFTWAYLRADLKEEIIPFTLDTMNVVTSPLIYQWLQHYNRIYYLGHDAQGHWYDLTNNFKQKLLAEQKRRRLVSRQFIPANLNLAGRVQIRELMLPAGDVLACQYVCDQEKGCGAYRYLPQKPVAKCQLYR